MMQQREAHLLIRNIAILPAEGPFIPRGFILLEGDRIKTVGSGDDAWADRVLDGEGCVAIPGLINAHTHLALTLYRGIADDVGLFEFLAETRKYWGKATPEEVTAAAVAGCRAAVRSGTTCLVDSYTTTPRPAAEAARRVGVRLLAAPGARSLWFGEPAPDTFAEGLRETEATTADYARDDLMFVPYLSAHSPYNCSAEQIRLVKAACRERDWLFAIHLAESQQEVDLVRRRTGMTPTAYLDSLDVLDERTLVAHGVYLTEDDIGRLFDRGAHLAHCPKSNAKLGNGVAPVPLCMHRGVSIGLGTDSMVSNNNLDMLEEMRFGALIHRAVQRTAAAPTARDLFHMATLGGARAIGLADQIGSLRSGKKADLVLLAVNPPLGMTEPAVLSELIFHTTVDAVNTVIVDGRIISDKRKACSG
jgi:5-methylthioadenosine/S-adenosylhomocysteine deaminase